MMHPLIEFVLGVVSGGLAVSTAWGLFWLGVSLKGRARGTCGWPVVLKSTVAGVVPLSLVAAVLWWMGGRANLAFGIGVLGMPTLLLGLWLRRMPDGRRAGTHMVAGVRQLMGEILGTHQGCGGCDHEHKHETCG
ncbi:MAG: hypothetical protein IPP12_13360 [Nitrospira sp.]|nr:hypothetical protein [Nitrospira sp.]MBK9948157.1 hypothetical protein [Nitrospira sp.]